MTDNADIGILISDYLLCLSCSSNPLHSSQLCLSHSTLLFYPHALDACKSLTRPIEHQLPSRQYLTKNSLRPYALLFFMHAVPACPPSLLPSLHLFLLLCHSTLPSLAPVSWLSPSLCSEQLPTSLHMMLESKTCQYLFNDGGYGSSSVYQCFPINSDLCDDSNMTQLNQKSNLSPQGLSLRGKYCCIPFDLTILSLSFPTLTPLTSYLTYLQHFLLLTYLFNNLFSQPPFLSLPFLWHVTILSPLTSIFSTNLVSLFSNSALIFHYLHVPFH